MVGGGGRVVGGGGRVVGGRGEGEERVEGGGEETVVGGGREDGGAGGREVGGAGGVVEGAGGGVVAVVGRRDGRRRPGNFFGHVHQDAAVEVVVVVVVGSSVVTPSRRGPIVDRGGRGPSRSRSRTHRWMMTREWHIAQTSDRWSLNKREKRSGERRGRGFGGWDAGEGQEGEAGRG